MGSLTFERELAQSVALAVKSATAPLLAKIAVLEARPVVSSDVLEFMKEAVTELRSRLLIVEAQKAVPGPVGPQGERGENGKDGAPGLNGKDGAAGVNGTDGAPGVNGTDGRDGIDGKDGAAGLNGKDGAPGLNGADGAPGVNGKDGAMGVEGKAGPDGAPGRDGRDGKDGAPGLHGRDGAPGLNGKDGAPGLSLDDFDFDFDPETRSQTIKFVRDGKVIAERTTKLRGYPMPRGVYEAGKSYEWGDIVTWDGSWWSATAETKDRPGNGATAWKMAVKHGEKGAVGPKGESGRDGKDLTQMDTSGRKW